jgi:DNA-binding XRE family transcriptional regulator
MTIEAQNCGWMTDQFRTCTFRELVMAKDMGLNRSDDNQLENELYSPTILVAFILGPFIPYLSVTVDTTLVVTVQNVVFAFNDPSQREVLELKWDSVFDPMIDVIREGDPTVDIQDSVVELDLQRISNGAVRSDVIKLKDRRDLLIGIRQTDGTAISTHIHCLLKVLIIKSFLYWMQDAELSLLVVL